jgi:hypothetical protein
MEIVFVLVWVVCGLGTMAVAQQRGGSGFGGLALGFLLGPLGLALSFAVFEGKQCAMCKQTIPANAQRCPKCQADLAPPSVASYRCPKCHTPVELNTPKCPGCGGLFKAGLTKKCPDCAEEVRFEARKCRFCGFIFAETGAEGNSTPNGVVPEPPPSTSSTSQSRLRTCSFCGVQTLGPEEKCSRCGQPF